MKERKSYIDVAKFVAIFLLYVEHTGLFVNLSGGGYIALKIWICSFHMPLFFIVFGMVTSTEAVARKKFFQVIDKRFRSLIIPYFIWSAFYASSLDTKFVLGTLYGTNPSLGYASTNQVLWFLPAMFCATIVFQVCINISYLCGKSKQGIVYLVELCLCGTTSLLLKMIRPRMGIIFGIDIAFTGTVFMLLGLLLKPLIDRIYCVYKKYIFILSILFIGIGFITSQYNPPKEIWASTMALAYYGKSYSLYIINATLSTVGIMCISVLIENIRILSWLGENSMLLMVLHFFIFDFTIKIVSIIVNENDFIIAIVNAIMCTFSSMPLIFLINRYAPILKGK